MRRACDTALVGCPGVDAPITNISAEAPDTLLFASTVWDPYRPYRPPILGDAEYNDTDCNSIFGPLWAIYDPVVYAETQLMANLIALATQLGCGHPEVPPEDPNSPTQVYINDAQTQSVFCPDGSEFSYTVEAGTLTSPPLNSTLGPIWVDWANAWASAYALEQASALMDCVTRPEQPPGVTPGGHTTRIIPPPPGTGGTPLLDETYYWCCLGDTLDDALNTYTFGGRGNLEYTITVTNGSIPPGTTFTQTGPRTCLLSGTPTQAGNWAWQIHAVSTTLPTVTIDAWDNLFVFGLTNGPLPDATAGTAYPDFQFTAAGGNGPTYTFTSSDLPTGFTLTDAGVLSSDTSTVEGDYTFTVRVTDELGAYCDQDVDISVLSSCPDFTTFVWTPFVSSSGNGYGHNTLAVPTTFDVLCGVLTNLPANQYQVSDYGVCQYTSAGCNVNLNYTLARIGDTTKICGQLQILTRVIPGAFVSLWSLDILTAGVDGTFNIPLLLPDPAGGTGEVKLVVIAQAKCVASSGLPQEISLTGSLTNI